MARIYSFETGEILHDSPLKEPLLRKLLGRAAGRASLNLTRESIESSEDRVNKAIMMGLAVQQAKADLVRPAGNMSPEELSHLIVEEAALLEGLSPAEKQHVTEYLDSVNGNSEQEIS